MNNSNKMWNKFWSIKKKEILPLILDSAPFWHAHSFWNFDHPTVNYDFETSEMEVFQQHRIKNHAIEQLRYNNQVRKETQH